ncbi:uncharacterized protein LOC127528835 isoform X1 [Erpetoichthys calabaricus]|uniref:uncharacterized protein LOC127528835 isoform X1 n=1 Tax=Erpetoichthys calabaricus TaxID=27687 RepID=UPI002233F2C4|nr:uncharacterized protein LOC127528835 isoform X1 [Erpetoichthys calabaricus]
MSANYSTRLQMKNSMKTITCFKEPAFAHCVDLKEIHKNEEELLNSKIFKGEVNGGAFSQIKNQLGLKHFHLPLISGKEKPSLVTPVISKQRLLQEPLPKGGREKFVYRRMSTLETLQEAFLEDSIDLSGEQALCDPAHYVTEVDPTVNNGFLLKTSMSTTSREGTKERTALNFFLGKERHLTSSYEVHNQIPLIENRRMDASVSKKMIKEYIEASKVPWEVKKRKTKWNNKELEFSNERIHLSSSWSDAEEPSSLFLLKPMQSWKRSSEEIKSNFKVHTSPNVLKIGTGMKSAPIAPKRERAEDLISWNPSLKHFQYFCRSHLKDHASNSATGTRSFPLPDGGYIQGVWEVETAQNQQSLLTDEMRTFTFPKILELDLRRTELPTYKL